MLKALGNKVIIKARSTGEELRKNGIILMDGKVPLQSDGEVLYVGPDVKDIAVGDWVHFPPQAIANARTINGQRVFTIIEAFIDAVEKKAMPEGEKL